MTLKAGYFFEINHQSFLAFCGSGKGFAAGKKLTGILNVNEPVTSQSWTEHQSSNYHFAFCILQEESKLLWNKAAKMQNNTVEVLQSRNFGKAPLIQQFEPWTYSFCASGNGRVIEKILKMKLWTLKKFIVNARQAKDKTDLNSETFNIVIHIDGLYKLRRWNWRESIVSVCFKNTVKVIDVIYKTTKCR